MNAFIKQYLCACAVALVSVAFETWSGSLEVRDFVTENGLLLISALFAINIATLAAILPMMRSIEESHFEPGAFLETRKAALNGVREMLVMGGLFYLLMVLAPDKYWCTRVFDKNCIQLICSYVVCILARACIFQTAYATYDFSRLLIKLSALK